MRASYFGVFAIVGVLGSACALPADPQQPISGEPPALAATSGEGDGQKLGAGLDPSSTAPLSPTSTATTMKGTSEQANAAVGGTAGTIAPTPAHPDDSYVEPLVLDACDDPTFAGVEYASVARDHFVYRFVAGTAAEKDLDAIAAAREDAYQKTGQFLGLTDAPTITIYMSPNRLAAKAHGYGAGYATAASNRIDVIYVPESDGYEHQHPGHEVTHVLSSKVDGAPVHLPLLDEGLAEYLDGSHRNLHAAYAAQLKGGAEASSSVTRFVDNDVYGKNYGRAGSFVTFLVERYGKEKFLDLWRASAATWSGWSLVVKDGTKVTTGVDLENAMDHMLSSIYGKSFDAMRAEWETELAPYLATAATPVSAADREEIAHVLRAMDWAVNNKSATAYRAGMEGFYCDSWTEETKTRIATTAVEARGLVRTEITSVNAINMKNYPQAMVYVVRHEMRGSVDTATTVQIWFERFPVGWRETWATAW